jgi:hypothetical protein
MSFRHLFYLGTLSMLLAGGTAVAGTSAHIPEPDGNGTVRVDFDDVPTGRLPAGWKAEATNGGGEKPVWKVERMPDAPSGTKVLTMRRPARPYGSAFNLCWTDATPFRDGTITVRFKAITGKVDRGGGIVWRVRDRNNYYVVRFNPLEDNFRLYTVKNGRRSMLATADVHLPDGWHTMKITHRRDRIVCYLDGRPLLRVTDRRFTESGGAGLWTKADAVTAFDDFTLSTEGDAP